MPYRPTFTGLPGVRKKMIEGVYSRTPGGFIAALEKHRVVSAAGDDGAVTVYRDDKGRLRGMFCRYMSILASETFPTKAACRRWLAEFLPKMYEFHQGNSEAA